MLSIDTPGPAFAGIPIMDGQPDGSFELVQLPAQVSGLLSDPVQWLRRVEIERKMRSFAVVVIAIGSGVIVRQQRLNGLINEYHRAA